MSEKQIKYVLVAILLLSIALALFARTKTDAVFTP